MQNTIFLSDTLQNILDEKAAKIGITTSAFISDCLEQLFKDELNDVPNKSYATLYTELREAVIEYKNSIPSGQRFTLLDVPYYKDLAFTTVHGTQTAPRGIRARLGRSINEAIRKGEDHDLADIHRARTKSGKLAFNKKGNTNAAVYEKK